MNASTSECRLSPTVVVWSAAVDVAVVLLFVVIGRLSHHEAASLQGVATTFWPFAVGLAAGWLIARAWWSPARVRPTGLIVWPVTVLVGLGLRAVSGQGVQIGFAIVAVLILGVFLLGWRAVGRLVARRARRV